MPKSLRNLWIAHLVSIAGDFLAIFAVLSTASFRLHGSPAAVTGVTVCYMLPLAILGPFAGAIADRWNPRRTMIASDVVRAALVLPLLLATTLPAMYAAVFAISIVSTLFHPAQMILIRSIISRDDLLRVNVRFQQATLLLRILSPTVAAALVARLGPHACYWIDGASFLISAALLRGTDDRLSPSVRMSSNTTALTFIATRRALVTIILALAAATFAISCATPLLAVFVRDLLASDVRLYGIISALIGAGTLAGSSSVRRLARSAPPPTLVLSGLAITSSGMGLIALARTPLFLSVAVVATGAGAGLLAAPAQTLIQSETPLEMMGRVSSSVTGLVSTAQILGLIFSGTVAGAIGIRPIFWLSAVILAGVAILTKAVTISLTTEQCSVR